MSRTQMFFALGLVFSLVLSIPALSVGLGPNQEMIEEDARSSIGDKVPIDKTIESRASVSVNLEHEPIRINNNTHFAEQAEENNWPGNGSEDNPYIIKGYEIDGSNHGYGIYIGNVTEHFSILDCKIQNSNGSDSEYLRNSGIYLYNTSNGRLEENIISNTSIGIVLTDSYDNMIVTNQIFENLEGMNISSSDQNILVDNRVSENEQKGIAFTSSHSNRITLNNVSFNQGSGVFLDGSNDNSITDHRSIGNNQTGLILSKSNENQVSTSTFENNEKGIEMGSSDENVLKNVRVIENDDFGLELESSDNNFMNENNISVNGGGGLHFVSSNSNTVNYTEFLSNSNYGISLEASANNLIYHNDFIDNGVQAYDDSVDNNWTNGYPNGGNHWSDHGDVDDHSGEDQTQAGSDGIVDSSYGAIEGGAGAKDDYPLVNPVPTPHVRIETPNSGQIFSNSTVFANWTAMERFTDSLMYEVRVDQREWKDVHESTQYNFTRLAVGEHTAEVKVRDLSGNSYTDSVTFEVDYQVDDIDISPTDSTVTAGDSQIYNATGYHLGAEIGLVPVDWSIDDAAGGAWDRYVYTSESAGTWTVTGTYNETGTEFEDTATLTVEPAPADQFKIDPIGDQTAGESFELSITAFDEFGNSPEDYSGIATIEDSTGTIDRDQADFNENTWSENVTITEARENVTIEVYDGNIFGESDPFEVEPAEPEYMTLEPGSDQNITAGETLHFSPGVYDTYDNPITEDPLEFSWENTTETGIFNETNIGEYNVTASYGNFTSNEITVTVEPSEADDVKISPSEDQEIVAGESVEFSAEAYDEFDNLITGEDDDFLWSAEGGFIDSTGVFHDDKAGEYGVRAIYHEGKEVRSDKVQVTVKPAEPDHITLEPGSDQTITAGETLDFSAGIYDEHDNLINDDDTDFSWENTDNTGRFHKIETGEYDVMASYDGVSESVTIQVEPGEVERVEISPQKDRTITAGDHIDFSAEAFDEYNNSITGDNKDFAWENTDGDGRFEIRKAGSYQVSASYDGVTSDSVTVEVEPGDVYRVELDPAEDQVIDTLQVIDFSAEAYDAYGNSITGNASEFTWENTSDEGLFDRKIEGEYQVTATFENVASSPVTVEVTLLDYRIEFGPLSDVNGDPVSDANITLRWDDKEKTVTEGTRGIYEFKIKLRKVPEETEFNYTIEHEELDETKSGSFYGIESGEVQVDEIGEKPRDPAGVGIAVAIILGLLIVVIIIAMIASFRKSQEIESEVELEKMKKEEDEFFEGGEEETIEEADEDVVEDFDEGRIEEDEDILEDFDEEAIEESDEDILDEVD